MNPNIIDYYIINCAIQLIITIENHYQIHFGKPVSVTKGGQVRAPVAHQTGLQMLWISARLFVPQMSGHESSWISS